MTRYETLKDRPKRFLSLTGNHTLEEFSALLLSFSKRFLAFVETQTLDSSSGILPKHSLPLLFVQFC